MGGVVTPKSLVNTTCRFVATYYKQSTTAVLVVSQNFLLPHCYISSTTMASNITTTATPTVTTTVNPHVAVLAFPFSSHAASLLAVVHRLAALSPNHTHFSFLSTPTSNNSIFSSHNMLHKNDDNVTKYIKAYDVWDGVPEGYTFVGKPQEQIGLFMKNAPESFKKGMEAAVAETGKKVTCLVTDAFFWFAAEMAEDIGVAWVPFWTAGPNSLSAHVYTDYIRETLGNGGIVGREDQPLNMIPSMSKIRVRDLPEGVVFGHLDSFFSNMLHKMGVMLPQAAAVFINSFEDLEPTMTNDLKSRFKRFFNIGPLNLISPPPSAPDTYGCMPWLDMQKDRSVAYVSFGSVAALPPHELEALAEALEASGVPFIWSLKKNFKVNLPKGFLERTESHGIVVPWAPQIEVLAHSAVGVFVTHCGWNSVLESIGAGVPMICRPFFGDQMLNARMVEDVWEIGVKVEGGIFTKNRAINNLDLIYSQEKGKKARENILALRELARTASGPKGSSTHNFTALSVLVSDSCSGSED